MSSETTKSVTNSTENTGVNDKMNEKSAASQSNDSNLITFDETNTVNSGKDINTKITALDTDLAQLRMELGTINNSVEEGLDRLGDSDTDLTAKVSETYKRLGEIDNAYKSLLQISSRIDRDIQKLNGDVSDVAELSASGIKNLEQSTIAQSHEFTQRNQQVASKVSQLVETSKLTNELLDQKIQSTTEVMLLIEKRVVGEIESLSSATEDKTANIESAVGSNKARILKLQSIDEAIIRRATTLEITSAELTVASQRIDSSVEQLELNSDTLSHGIEKLKERTLELEAVTSNHGTLIGGLQKVTSDISDKLAVLTGREQKHFNIVTAGFLMLLVVTAVIYLAMQDQFVNNDVKIADRSDAVNSMVFNLQQAQLDASMNTNDSLTALENKIEQVNSALQDEIENELAQVDQKIVTMNDQVQSVEGRLNESSPFSNIGNDNIIHSEQWITQLPQQNFTVQLAYVDSKDVMFEIAQRYNYYLKDSLSYFEVEKDGVTKYALLSGNYETQQQALTAVASMPRYIDMQNPIVRKLDTVQTFIAQ